mmetsp:Transcript_32088/g.39506  ORF Transcript_32088/g.39506 Transcript_32088/m.39506 type:complete len:356 (+) Transcript_32088:217-1284(+)
MAGFRVRILPERFALLLQVVLTVMLFVVDSNSNAENTVSDNESGHCRGANASIYFDCVPCAYVLGPSKTGGVGIYSGASYRSDVSLEEHPYMVISKEMAYGNPLINYVWSHNETHFMFAFGAIGMLNHHNEKESVDRRFEEGTGMQNKYVSLITLKAVSPGEELFISYGDGKYWFQSHGVEYVEPDEEECSVEDLSSFPGKLPGCGDSHHLEAKSTQPENKNNPSVSSPFFIHNNTVIETSRVLILRISNGVDERENEFKLNGAEQSMLNYHYFKKISNELMLLSLGVSITFAQSTASQENANIKLEWVLDALEFGKGIAMMKVIATKDIEPNQPFILLMNSGNNNICLHNICSS